jgi:hypothetical protein
MILLYNYQKIQLWANSDKSEYAIYLKERNSNKGNKNNNNNSSNKATNRGSQLLVATNHNRNIKYTELLDEADYLEDLEYYWKYTLEQWIDNNNYGLKTIPETSLPPILLSHTAATNSKGSLQEQEENRRSANNKIPMHRNFRIYRIRKDKKNLKKCHFCKLLYLTNKERAEHEQAWHANNNSDNYENQNKR